MKPLRTLTMILAVVVSGLALVAVAPAPPAAAVYSRTFTQGSLNIVPYVSPFCTTSHYLYPSLKRQVATAWFRRFHLADENLYAAFKPQLVRFGVTTVIVSSVRASVPVRVRVYRYPANDPTLTWAELQGTPYMEKTVELTAASKGTMAVAAPRDLQGLFGTLDPATEDAVVEVDYAGGPPGEYFIMGANQEWESAPSYRRAPCAGQEEIGEHSPFSNVVITLEGADTGYLSDVDSDGAPDDPDKDTCPRRSGPLASDYPGCPFFSQAVSADYEPASDVVFGSVSSIAPGGTGSACSGQVHVQIRDAETSQVIGTARTSGESRSYEWRALGIPENRRLYAFVDGYLDRDNAGLGIGMCTSSTGAYVTVTGHDSDLDEVLDSQDSCPTRDGDASTAGCPYVAMAINAAPYVNGVVSGTLRVADSSTSADMPEEAPCQAEHQVVLSVGPGRTYTDTAASGSGAFSFEVDMDDKQPYAVSAAHYIDGEVAWCGSTRTEVLTAFVDADGDGVSDSVDACDDVRGPSTGVPLGCPRLEQLVTARYEGEAIKGVVSVDRAGVVPDTACAGPATVQVWQIGANGRVSLGSVLAAGDGSYRVPVGQPVHGAKFQASVQGYLDPEIASCLPGESAIVEMDIDHDGDGVLNDDDECDAVKAVDTVDGCPTIEREFTDLHVAPTLLAGTLRVKDSTVGGCAASNEVSLQLGDSGDAIVEETVAPSGEFEFVTPEVADGDAYVITAARQLDPNAGWCAAVETQGVVEIDLDNDGVNDWLDLCPTLNAEAGSPSGCPTVEREFTSLRYVDGKVMGNLTRKDAGDRGCTADNQVTVTPGDGGMPASGWAAETSGAFEIPVGLADGDVYVLSADTYLDSAAGWCDKGETAATVEIDLDNDDVNDDLDQCPHVDGPTDDQDFPGCPTLARTVTAAYAGGAISGQIGVLGPNQATAGTCLPTRVRAFTVVNGAAVQVGATTDTTADGSYTIALGTGLAARSTYFVASDRYLDGEDAVCGAAQSPRHQLAAIIAPPGGQVPPEGQGLAGGAGTPVGPVLSGVKLTKKVIHVAGSRVMPRATKVKLRLNMAAKVVVTVKGTSKATGKKVKARLVKSLGAGASAIKLTAKTRRKRLPAGTYKVTVRATNTVGAATATAGRLKLKP